MQTEIQSKKKKNKIFLKICLLLLVSLILWFLIFNMKQIRSGRTVKIEELVSQEYQSQDEKIYIYFLNQEKVYQKLQNEETTMTSTKTYALKDGMIQIEDDQRLILLTDGKKLYDLKNRKVLYLNN